MEGNSPILFFFSGILIPSLGAFGRNILTYGFLSLAVQAEIHSCGNTYKEAGDGLSSSWQLLKLFGTVLVKQIISFLQKKPEEKKRVRDLDIHNSNGRKSQRFWTNYFNYFMWQVTSQNSYVQAFLSSSNLRIVYRILIHLEFVIPASSKPASVTAGLSAKPAVWEGCVLQHWAARHSSCLVAWFCFTCGFLSIKGANEIW